MESTSGELFMSDSVVLPSFDGRALIQGQRVAARSGAVFDCISPVDGRVLTQVARCAEADIDAAVQAARAAFEDRRWAGKPP
ncbi:aldehyde dehydrogenase family protein, partial [Arthrospira platensis SPKY1]|nr:aldehyde dehydrogenase family protein [Arthrospira platensis SPKY1]